VTAVGAPLGDMVKHIVSERLDAADRAHRCQQVSEV
jgi:hypothetical protein